MQHLSVLCVIIALLFSVEGCSKKGPLRSDWNREATPIFRDMIESENYQVASDAHVFFDENDDLKMVYTGDFNGQPSIKIASGSNWTSWEKQTVLLGEVGPSNLDKNKETPFYRLADNGKHQIYYIGYDDEDTYQSQIFLAEATSLTDTFIQKTTPLIPRGTIAGKEVYCITSPSIVAHNDTLFMAFIGWNDSPNNVSEVWVFGATSVDDGYTWSDFKEVDTRIGMEGQLTKGPNGKFYAVRTGDYKKNEGIFIAAANHPFGDWEEEKKPIILKAGEPFEVDEIIAPQLIFDPVTNQKKLYYTGADHQIGWWIMMATEPDQ